jgi:hypothetical protein
MDSGSEALAFADQVIASRKEEVPSTATASTTLNNLWLII